MGERNLVFESFGRPRRGSGALIVYLSERDRGLRVCLNRGWQPGERERWRPQYGDMVDRFPYLLEYVAIANVVRRMVNGEQTYSAWFPELEPETYNVDLIEPVERKGKLEPVADKVVRDGVVTVFRGEVSELDWGED